VRCRTLQPRLGISQTVSPRLTVEAYAAATFFTANSDYYGGLSLTQKPFVDAQLHASYTFATPGV
jgi:hypothetical protein